MFGEIKHANYLDDVKSKIRFYGTNGGLITCRSGYFLAESENSFSRHIFIMGDW